MGVIGMAESKVLDMTMLAAMYMAASTLDNLIGGLEDIDPSHPALTHLRLARKEFPDG